MQQFAISEATLFGWNSMDGESIGAGSNHGSVAHLSEVNQESITSRGTAVWFELVLGGTLHMGSDWTEVFRCFGFTNKLWTVAFQRTLAHISVLQRWRELTQRRPDDKT